jgi:hypothetical protein
MKQDKRTLAELVKAYLSEESAAEFDRIVRESKPHRSRLLIWGSMLAAAASLALILTLTLSESRCEFNGVEIAEGIQQIMNLDTDEVKSVIATPEGSRVILTASMKDGSQCSYVMSRNNGTEAVSITAMK